MPNHNAMLQEFIARKEQILNLEMRLFILVLVVEFMFILLYLIFNDRIKKQRTFSLLAASSFFVLFFEIIAINGKMGLISMYLRQMEIYMQKIGFVGAIWESKALDAIIFCPGNAFTLPASLTVLLLLAQAIYVIQFTISCFISHRTTRLMIVGTFALLLMLLIAKTVSVDFHAQQLQIFNAENVTAEP